MKYVKFSTRGASKPGQDAHHHVEEAPSLLVGQRVTVYHRAQTQRYLFAGHKHYTKSANTGYTIPRPIQYHMMLAYDHRNGHPYTMLS